MMRSQIKFYVAGLFFALSIGATASYFLAKLDSSSNQFTGNAIAAISPENKAKQIDLKPLPIVNRGELVLKYQLCTKTKVSSKLLDRFNDQELNDLVYRVCTEAS
jgi:hypothetical protein